jgi:hypothetical protein
MSLLIFGKGKTSADATIEPMDSSNKGLYYSLWLSSSSEFWVPFCGSSCMTKHVLAIIYINNWILVLRVPVSPFCVLKRADSILLAVCLSPVCSCSSFHVSDIVIAK